MTFRAERRYMPRVGRRVLGIASAIALMTMAIALVVHLHGRIPPVPTHPAASPSAVPGAPIPSEALVFRLAPGDLAVEPTVTRRSPAHRRTLARYHASREYPGAPPRIPHGLTSEEYRSVGCLTCHERGGFAPRFGAYAPPTPHPEYAECLQCHVPDARLVGIALPTTASVESCGQCHVNPDDPRPTFVALDWRPSAWPATDQRAMDGSPPLIPHTFQLRGNCLACHGGPTAVEEIRTPHPERTNCRQCHLPAAAEEALFERPLDGFSNRAGGAP